MAKLYFRFGAMGSSKTANALMVAFNYEEKGLNPLVLKPQIEVRDMGENGSPIIKSRIGLWRNCNIVEDFIVEDWDSVCEKCKGFDCIIVDEVQFCTISQIKTFRRIVTELEIPVICYGLREDFLQNAFDASKELAGCADVIEELKTVCWCGQGATCNARLDAEGNVVRHGNQIELGGNDKYTSLCRKHYLAGDIGPKMRKLIDEKRNK